MTPEPTTPTQICPSTFSSGSVFFCVLLHPSDGGIKLARDVAGSKQLNDPSSVVTLLCQGIHHLSNVHISAADCSRIESASAFCDEGFLFVAVLIVVFYAVFEMNRGDPVPVICKLFQDIRITGDEVSGIEADLQIGDFLKEAAQDLRIYDRRSPDVVILHRDGNTLTVSIGLCPAHRFDHLPDLRFPGRNFLPGRFLAAVIFMENTRYD